MTAVILAGGRSRRFGSDKSLADWAGRPAVEHLLVLLRPLFPERLVVAKEPDRYGAVLAPGDRAVSDDTAFQHPLVGLKAGLEHAATPYCFVCACDMPLLAPSLVSALCLAAPGWAAVVPVWEGAPQPLAAVYSRTCLDALRPLRHAQRDKGGLSVRGFLSSVRARFMTEAEVSRHDPTGDSFQDFDTVGDYGRMKEASLAQAL